MNVPRGVALALAFALLVGPTAAGCADTIAGSASPSVVPPDAAGSTAAPATPAPPMDVVVAEQGFSTYRPSFSEPVVSYGVVIRNPNPASWYVGFAYLKVTFLDVKGATIGADTVGSVHTVPPGGTAAWAATDLFGRFKGTASIRVDVTRTRWVRDTEVQAAAITAGPAVGRPVAPDGTISIHTRLAVTCDLTSTFPSPVSDMNVTLLFRDAGGTIIGGDVESADVDGVDLVVPPGGPTTVDLLAGSPPLSGVPVVDCVPNYSAPEK